MTNNEPIPAWYALHTKSRCEAVVNQGLQKKAIDAFLPLIQVRSKRRDRKMMIRVPLFPGYIFVKTDLTHHHHLEILKTVGAVRLIGSRAGPVSVPEDNIESLKIMVCTDNPIETGSRYKAGDRVLVIRGPFEGVVGTFSHYRGQDRVIVHIEALGQFAAVEVELEDIEILPQIMA